MDRTRIKICCIANEAEAEMAIGCGADAIGLVGQMPSGPGIISDEQAKIIAQSTQPPISSFLLTSEITAQKIADHVNFVGADTVQIVNHISNEVHKELKQHLPNTKRVQVIHVEDEAALELIPVYEPFVHAFLLDSGKPSAPTPQLGGTGRTHDWEISRRFVERVKKPVFLAGGLTPNNIADAIRNVQPFGIDLCSGVRKNGHLDLPTLIAFMKAVKQVEQS